MKDLEQMTREELIEEIKTARRLSEINMESAIEYKGKLESLLTLIKEASRLASMS